MSTPMPAKPWYQSKTLISLALLVAITAIDIGTRWINGPGSAIITQRIGPEGLAFVQTLLAGAAALFRANASTSLTLTNKS